MNERKNDRTTDIVRIALCGILVIAFVLTVITYRAPVGATDAAPGVGIGENDGDVDGDGVIDGPVGDGTSPAEQIVGEIGEGISRGLDEASEKGDELASDLMSGGTEGTAPGPYETDGGVVRDDGEKGRVSEDEKKAADTIWVVVAVAATVAVIAAVAVAVPRRRSDGEKK